MDNSTEYQIFIGCNDPDIDVEVINEQDLQQMITEFFEYEETDFSLIRCKGGYISKSGYFINENSLCINIIGGNEKEIRKLSENLSMLMHQEHVLVLKQRLETSFQ